MSVTIFFTPSSYISVSYLIFFFLFCMCRYACTCVLMLTCMQCVCYTHVHVHMEARSQHWMPFFKCPFLRQVPWLTWCSLALLPPPPQFQEYKCAPLDLVFIVAWQAFHSLSHLLRPWFFFLSPAPSCTPVKFFKSYLCIFLSLSVSA